MNRCCRIEVMIVAILAGFLIASTGWAATYYVDGTNGNDSKPGTSAEPWRTIQKAANTMAAGDTVTVLAGSYASERVQVTRSGSSGAMITFQAQGTVTMKGFTVNANYITIRGFYITGTDDNNTTGWGIYYKGSNGSIEGNHVYSATRGGIILATTAGNETGTSNCIIRDNKAERNQDVGIEVHGRNHLIELNEVWDTIQYHPNYANPPSWVDADGFRYFGSGHTFRKNYIHDILYGPPGINPAIGDYNDTPHTDAFQTFATDAQHEVASNCTFEENIINLLESYPAVGLGCKGFEVEGKMDGTSNSLNLVFKNNIVRAPQTARFKYTTNLTMLNNTLVGNTADSATGIWLKQCITTTIQNNIFAYQDNGQKHISSDAGDPSESTLTAGYNCVYRGAGLIPTRLADPYDVWNENPLFVDKANGDYHLQANSPCVDAGKILDSVTDDLDGNPRPVGSGYDIGAYEFVPSTSPLAPVNLRIID
jgi:hypothetical protein